MGLQESTAFVSLTVPLGRFVAAVPSGGGVGEGEALPSGLAAPSTPRHDSAGASERNSRAGGRAARATRLTPALARATVRAALRASSHAVIERRLAGAASRARASAGLPEARLRGARVIDESLRLSPTVDDPYRYSRAGGTNLLFEARLTWKLDRLVFADEELGIERLRTENARSRGQLVERVLKALVAWQRALVRAADPAALPHERELLQLSALEAELVLDALTAGWFSTLVTGVVMDDVTRDAADANTGEAGKSAPSPRRHARVRALGRSAERGLAKRGDKR
jgi:hypothetical protein